MEGEVKEGFIRMIESGTRRFALVITDEQKAKKFFADNSYQDIVDKYDAALQESLNKNIKFAQATSDAVKKTLGNDSGISYYRTDDDTGKDKTKFIKLK